MKLIYSGESKFIIDALNNIGTSNAKIYQWNSSIDGKENIADIEAFIFQSSIFETFEKVIIKNVPLFMKSKKNNCEKLLSILKDIKEEVIITVNDEKLEIPESYASLISEQLIPKLAYNNVNNYIERCLKENNVQYKLEHVNLLKTKLGNNPWVIESEVKKLAMYNNVLITENIEKYTNDFTEQNIFKMIEWVLKEKYDNAIFAFDEMCPDQKSPEEVLSIMVTHLFKLKVMMLYKKNNKTGSLKEEFKLKDFQEKETLSLMSLVSIDKINQILNNLIKLDKGFKQGMSDLYTRLRLLIAGGIYGF